MDSVAFIYLKNPQIYFWSYFQLPLKGYFCFAGYSWIKCRMLFLRKGNNSSLNS